MSLLPFLHVDEVLTTGRAGDRFELSEREWHHVRTVLRLGTADPLRVADGHGSWADARVSDSGVELASDAVEQVVARPRLGVAQALGKGRKVDEVVRVVTELGVESITIVAAARSVTRIAPAKADRSRQRWESIARAACEQSRRARRPVIDGPVPPTQVAARPGCVWVAHPGGMPLPRLLRDQPVADTVTLAVGPEGGWTDGEVAEMIEHGATTVGLGPTILRTEHAAAAALAVVSACLGRWDATTDRPA